MLNLECLVLFVILLHKCFQYKKVNQIIESMIIYCRHNNCSEAYRDEDRMLFESNKCRLLNELDCLEETIVRRQQELREVEERLQQNSTDLAAVQIEVLLCFLTNTISVDIFVNTKHL